MREGERKRSCSEHFRQVPAQIQLPWIPCCATATAEFVSGGACFYSSPSALQLWPGISSQLGFLSLAPVLWCCSEFWMSPTPGFPEHLAGGSRSHGRAVEHWLKNLFCGCSGSTGVWTIPSSPSTARILGIPESLLRVMCINFLFAGENHRIMG